VWYCTSVSCDAFLVYDYIVVLKIGFEMTLSLLVRSSNFERKAFLAEPVISSIYFQAPEDPNFQNFRSYLPPELQHQVPYSLASCSAVSS
jgi:hypothetical protein